MSHDADAIIIGAGPVGLTLANLLAQDHVRVIVLEARSELIDFPRAVGIDDEALRTIQSIGLVEKVLPHTVPDQKIRIINGDRKVIAEINPTTREFGWPRRNGFVQPLVDRVLHDGLERFPNAEVRFSSEVVELQQDDDSVTVSVRNQNGEEQTLTASFVVGCEGGRSFTRQKLGLEFKGETRRTRGLVIDVANDPIGNPHAIFGGDPKRGYATLSLPHGIRRWEFTLCEGESEEVVQDDDFVFGLLENHVPNPRELNIIRRRVYEHHARIAEKFHVGRVFLAGDAAHVMPVVAGQGWNSGMRDALNLGWKLSSVIHGKASRELLDTYEIERRDHVKALVELSLNMANLVTDHNRLRTAVRDLVAAVVDRIPSLKARLSSQGFKPMPKYDRGVVVASPVRQLKSMADFEGASLVTGTLMPQPRVQNAMGEEMLLDDATGQGWRVLLWNNDPLTFLSKENLAALESLGCTLVQLVPAGQLSWARSVVGVGVTLVGDPRGELKQWFDQRPASAIVVRPDHVVAAECVAQDLDTVIQQVLAAGFTVSAEHAELSK